MANRVHPHRADAVNDTALGVLLVALALAAELAAVVAIGRHLIRTAEQFAEMVNPDHNEEDEVSE
jgi:hypothetical protein